MTDHPGPDAPPLDERALAVIRRYATPDRRGWTMPPADVHYRLTRWHKVEITREQVAEVLRTGQHALP